MKKYIFIILIIFIVTGCKEATQLTCNGSYNKDNYDVSSEITAYFDQAERLKNAKVVLDFHDKKITDKYCNQFKQLEDVEDNIEVSCEDTKIISEGFTIIDVDTNTINYLDKTKDEFMQTMNELAFTCK